jgi:hypothetical protein
MKKAGRSEPRGKPEPKAVPTGKPMFRPPLKPRPRLLRALLGVMGVWIAVLLTLYFVTVYPHRASKGAPARLERAGESVSR